MTQHDILLAAFQDLGYTIDGTARTTRYTVLRAPTPNGGNVYLGRGGALRFGSTVTGSAAALPQTKRRYLTLGRKVLGKRER